MVVFVRFAVIYDLVTSSHNCSIGLKSRHWVSLETGSWKQDKHWLMLLKPISEISSAMIRCIILLQVTNSRGGNYRHKRVHVIRNDERYSLRFPLVSTDFKGHHIPHKTFPLHTSSVTNLKLSFCRRKPWIRAVCVILCSCHPHYEGGNKIHRSRILFTVPEVTYFVVRRPTTGAFSYFPVLPKTL